MSETEREPGGWVAVPGRVATEVAPGVTIYMDRDDTSVMRLNEAGELEEVVNSAPSPTARDGARSGGSDSQSAASARP